MFWSQTDLSISVSFTNYILHVLQQSVLVDAYILRCVPLLINAAVLMAIEELTVKCVCVCMNNNIIIISAWWVNSYAPSPYTSALVFMIK